MKRIDVKCSVWTDGYDEPRIIERTFRTNDSGAYLFVGTSENKQINCDHYGTPEQMKRAIRTYMTVHYDRVGRIAYSVKW